MAYGSLQPGQLDRKCSLAHRAIVKNDQGEDAQTWDVAYDTRVWARQNDVRGQKRLAAQEFSTDHWCEFRIRYRTDLLITDRITDESGNVFEITNIAEIGRRAGLDLLCRAIAK